jgi:hypothetical protein
VICSNIGDEETCNNSGVCYWNSGNNTCEGSGNAEYCGGTYSNGYHWYPHVLERGLSYTEKTANYTVTNIDDIVNCTSNSFTLTLPDSIVNSGKKFYLKNTGAGTITLNTTNSQTIDGNASGILTLTTGDSMIVISNNQNWVIV